LARKSVVVVVVVVVNHALAGFSSLHGIVFRMVWRFLIRVLTGGDNNKIASMWPVYVFS